MKPTRVFSSGCSKVLCLFAILTVGAMGIGAEEDIAALRQRAEAGVFAVEGHLNDSKESIEHFYGKPWHSFLFGNPWNTSKKECCEYSKDDYPYSILVTYDIHDGAESITYNKVPVGPIEPETKMPTFTENEIQQILLENAENSRWIEYKSIPEQDAAFSEFFSKLFKVSVAEWNDSGKKRGGRAWSRPDERAVARFDEEIGLTIQSENPPP